MKYHGKLANLYMFGKCIYNIRNPKNNVYICVDTGMVAILDFQNDAIKFIFGRITASDHSKQFFKYANHMYKISVMENC